MGGNRSYRLSRICHVAGGLLRICICRVIRRLFCTCSAVCGIICFPVICIIGFFAVRRICFLSRIGIPGIRGFIRIVSIILVCVFAVRVCAVRTSVIGRFRIVRILCALCLLSIIIRFLAVRCFSGIVGLRIACGFFISRFFCLLCGLLSICLFRALLCISFFGRFCFFRSFRVVRGLCLLCSLCLLRRVRLCSIGSSVSCCTGRFLRQLLLCEFLLVALYAYRFGLDRFCVLPNPADNLRRKCYRFLPVIDIEENNFLLTVDAVICLRLIFKPHKHPKLRICIFLLDFREYFIHISLAVKQIPKLVGLPVCQLQLLFLQQRSV